MSYELQKIESYALLGGINTKASPYINEQTEFRDITNYNFVIPGALTKRPGTDGYLGATVAGRVHSGFEFERLSGASCLVAGANSNFYEVTNAWSPARSGMSGNMDFVSFVDRLFVASGDDFFKYDCTNTSTYGLPVPAGFSIISTAGGSLAPGITQTFVFSYGFVNDRGYFGPPAAGLTLTVEGSAGSNTGAYVNLQVPPAGYGITAIALYRSLPDGTDVFFTTFLPLPATSASDTGFPLSTFQAPSAFGFTLKPRYIELYNNQLFMAGFSSVPSTLYWSDIGEPESVQPESFTEVRTNDGDRIMALRAYSGSLIIMKERSFHRLSGDDPDNFLLQEVSDEYGCLSNRAALVWENFLWFLDPKGIIEYNGANIAVVSNKIEPIMQRMNISAARDNACAIHYRERNELWFGIPVDGSTKNNIILVYDYVAKAWTKYEGLDISCLFLAKASLPARTPFFGGYTGTMSYFGVSLASDSGAGITCLIDTMFHAKSVQTMQAMWRRFYINVNPIGSTQALNVNMRQDYGVSLVLSRVMYQSPFQSRIDFGISSRSVAAQVSHFSATNSISIFGYAFEWRYLRAV